MNYQEIKEIFGSKVFDRKKMKEHLPSHVWEKLIDAMDGRAKLDASIADVVASAMKEWALSVGATHWTHWFHPRTERTAEKHSAFISTDLSGASFYSFSGRDLIQSEPDASSFPSGGMRSTFEARGYSAWDPSSPAFVVSTPKGGVLCIPSVFLSYDGTPLDIKTSLLRSLDAVESRTMKLLRMLGNRGAKFARVTIGAEQEYFLIDRPRAQTRPDIRTCGRTLIGGPFPKNQHAEAHYFGSIAPRVLAYMEDVERDLARFGVNITTRHNEVAPCQFEFAPLFSEANLACDQNQIIMETMRNLARKHQLRLLFHEKPFAGINGSGKHINFSICDDEGHNLLQPAASFRKNVTFLCLVSGLMMGVAEYHGLLNAIVATPGNLRRLGGNEAPPSIISMYLGEALNSIFEAISEGHEKNLPEQKSMEIGLNKLPSLVAYNCDRNRTSPLAFTGNKFEFRAPGSAQAIASPATMLMSIWAWGLDRMIEKLERYAGAADGKTAAIQPEAILEALREAEHESHKIRFEGNAYTAEWIEEAQKRGLIVPKSMPDAIDLFLDPKNEKMLSELGIYSKREMESYHETRTEQFCDALETEMGVLRTMMWEGVLPAISKQIIQESDAISDVIDELPEADIKVWKDKIKRLAHIKVELIKLLEKLDEQRGEIHTLELSPRAHKLVDEALPIMDKIRELSDEAEGLTSKEIWPYLTYRDLLSVS